MGDPIIQPSKTYKNLREGDFLTAKKNFHLVNKFYKGCRYQITTINNYGGEASGVVEYALLWIGKGPEYFITKDNHIVRDQPNHEYVWDYFYTEKELRTLKLKEIGIKS